MEIRRAISFTPNEMAKFIKKLNKMSLDNTIIFLKYDGPIFHKQRKPEVSK